MSIEGTFYLLSDISAQNIEESYSLDFVSRVLAW
jgi:hypothetical protein